VSSAMDGIWVPLSLSPSVHASDMPEAGGQTVPDIRNMVCFSVSIKEEATMPAKSKSQQQAAGIALAAKRGDKKVGDLKGPSESMYESMSEKELRDMASTKTKNKPDHKSDKK
jgi:hypothetical protein